MFFVTRIARPMAVMNAIRFFRRWYLYICVALTGPPECPVLSPSRNSHDTTAAHRPPPDKILKNRAIDPVATASLDRKTPKSATSLTRRPTKLGLFRKMPSSSPANQTTATPMSVALTHPSPPDKILKNREIDPVPPHLSTRTPPQTRNICHPTPNQIGFVSQNAIIIPGHQTAATPRSAAPPTTPPRLTKS